MSTIDDADCAILDLTPADVPFVVYSRGSVRALLEFYETNPDGTQGDPLDFTGWTGFTLVAYNPADATAQYFELTQGSGLDVNGNAVTVTISKANIATYAAAWQSALYFLEAVDQDGATQPICGGQFILTLQPIGQLGLGSL